MYMVPWKTNAVLKRYDMVSEDDLAEAAPSDEKHRLETEKQKQAEAEAQAQAERGQTEAWAQFGHHLTTAPASGKLTN
jgi:hypothetical protein